jgi:DNA repair ATPase RecN
MKPTTEQILSALNKLVKENQKTELKAEKVELSLVSEFKSDYNKAIKKSLSLTEEVATFSSKKNDLESEVNKNISDFEKLQKPYSAIVKQAKELGININDVLDDRPNISQDIKSMKDALKLLK